MENRIKIGNRFVSEDSSVFTIAEIGLNHNGKVSIAKKLIDEAKKCGVDAVKFQTYKTENFINEKYAKDQYEIFKKYELNYNDFYELKNYADRKKIIFLSAPYDFESADFLFKINVPAYKVGSSELSNIYFVKYLASKGLPLIISTGLHSFNDIETSFRKIYRINKKIILLHCVSEYPLNIENANMNSILFLKEKFKTIVGFSDHSEGDLLAMLAISLGAKVIEKHFTLDKRLKGPDHKFSMQPSEMKEMVSKIRLIEKALGKKDKIITKNEKKIKKYALKGIYAKEDIRAGENITFDKILLQRPLMAKPSSELEKIIGQKSKSFIKKGEKL